VVITRLGPPPGPTAKALLLCLGMSGGSCIFLSYNHVAIVRLQV